MRQNGLSYFLLSLLVTTCFAILSYGGTPPQSKNLPPAGFQKIKHVIWIIQENRSFDNYFGTYPKADGIPPGTCLPVLPGSKRCVDALLGSCPRMGCSSC